MLPSLVLRSLAVCLSPVLAGPLGVPLLGGSDNNDASPGTTPSPPPVDHPSPKLVVAHFMVGTAYYYTPNTWHTQIQRAIATDINAFALNIGKDDWQLDRVRDALDAASKYDDKFKCFISLDMDAIPCKSPADAAYLQKMDIKRFFNEPSYQTFKGKPLLSAFSGASCHFGRASSNEGWEWFVGDDAHFVPSFFIPPQQASDYPVLNGIFPWNSAWPQGKNEINFGSDKAWIDHIGDRTYMAAVSPWFFTHFPQKNFIYYMDKHMLVKRWEDIIANSRDVDIVQIVSWNDFSEGHAIGPLLKEEAIPTGAEAWTKGYDHTGWLDLFKYYIHAFKTGVYPVIKQDQIFCWGRLSPAPAQATSDSLPPPRDAGMSEDAVWAMFLLATPAEIELRCGQTSSKKQAPAGAVKHMLPLSENGCQVEAYIRRTGEDEWSRSFAPKGYVFNTQPATYNFNAFVAASSAAPDED
ncbi:hypothetical protein MKEN_01063000 [Mycena kentingensis (nom. inval.)]|nr:hypothetical protein MKEN_01063000 [Mycena kentingensis (nom. inval.)]